jgi:hypothetical protein
MRLNHFSRRILAPAAATGYRQAHLHFEERAGALIDDFADLAIADCMAQTDVHGSRLSILAALARTAAIGDHPKY